MRAIAKYEIVAVGELHPDWQSRLIQMGIMAPYSHIAILVYFSDETIEVFECIGKGIIKSTVDDLLDRGGAVIRERFTLSVSNKDEAYGWLKGRLGVKYSLIQYLGFMFPFLKRLHWIDNGRSASVCSEFGADFCGEYDDSSKDHIPDTDFVSPRDLVEILQSVRARN